ncbi:MAG TPA: TetR/AcrR family transcriptional regulator [Actinomycetota bacterium]|nr:TetR/AcrR family transcriptional regulator [Actinomycetota bacterium]
MARTATPPKPRVPLSRERIADAALHIMDTDGLDAVSMRRVAREVGVEAMSLYNHVQDKDDLLNGVVERVMREFPYPEGDAEDDWLPYGREIARGWRNLLRAHPSLVRLFAERKSPISSVESLRPMEAALAALRNAGLSEHDAVQAFHTIGGYIFGSVMMETGQLFGDPADARAFPDVTPDQLPSVAACAPYLAECDFDEQFEFGLDLMLEGLRAKVESA